MIIAKLKEDETMWFPGGTIFTVRNGILEWNGGGSHNGIYSRKDKDGCVLIGQCPEGTLMVCDEKSF